MRMKSIQAMSVLMIALLSSLAAFAQEPAAQTKDNAISGRVVSESGQPLPGVYVSVSTLGGLGGRRTTTDNEGSFKVQGLDAGIYRIFLNAPGYVVQIPTDSAPTYRPGDKAELTLVKGGVIAGTITNIAGEPVVNISVRAYQIRDTEGNKIATQAFSQPKISDDRGYYRIYGLQPGTYIVAAGGQGQYFGSVNPFANDAMTFAPASTRDTAAEIVVRSDQEATADIRYRAEPGHAVSGKVSGPQAPLPFSPSVRLTDLESHVVMTSVQTTGPDRTFQLNGISDGEYEINAISPGGQNNEVLASSSRKIAVRGADVTGLDLALAAMGSVDAQVNLEADAKLNCGRRRDTAMKETMVVLRRSRPEEKSGAARTADTSGISLFASNSFEAVPNEKGELHYRNLSSATYRFDVRLPAAGWYLRDVAMDQRPGPRTESTISRSGLSLKLGEKISGITITIAEGGASLRGRVTVPEGQSLPPLRIYLAPAERENSDNPLRFFEDAVAADGTFAIAHVAPGRFWLLAQPAEQIDATTIKSTRSDGSFRAKVLRAAEALKKEIALKPCERTTDYELSYSSSPRP